MEIVIDACAIMAVIVKEPERETVIRLTRGAVMIAPDMVSFEIANALTRMLKKNVIDKKSMMKAFGCFRMIPIKTVEVNFERVLEIAWNYKIYAYDACYLEVADRLGLPLLTFDRGMARAGKSLGINMLGEKKW